MLQSLWRGCPVAKRLQGAHALHAEGCEDVRRVRRYVDKGYPDVAWHWCLRVATTSGVVENRVARVDIGAFARKGVGIGEEAASDRSHRCSAAWAAVEGRASRRRAIVLQLFLPPVLLPVDYFYEALGKGRREGCPHLELVHELRVAKAHLTDAHLLGSLLQAGHFRTALGPVTAFASTRAEPCPHWPVGLHACANSGRGRGRFHTPLRKGQAPGH
mmetsp:Transcript_76479/g.164041  ORF Transcript_76479/g.164041 Transcript_76479/m.164041 type:complete len:216 (-) Transcript_76479:413-1060(-)